MDKKCMVKVQGNVIETTVTCKGCVVDEWIRKVLPTAHSFKNIVGIDRQSVYKEFGDGTKLLQVCIGTKCLLYQSVFYETDTPRLLPSLFHDRGFIFVGVSIMETMEGATSAFRPVNSIDIEELAVERWCWPKQYIKWKPGLKILAKSVADLNIDEMPQRLRSSILQSKELSAEQIEYACAHVYASFTIGCELLKHGNSMPNMMKSPDDDE